MSWLEKIRQKPQPEKMRIIWTVTLIVGILLIIVWIISANYAQHGNNDTGFFKTIFQGIVDVKNNLRK